jgi:hypothetical protein
LLGYFAVVLLVVGVGLTFIFIGRQANRTGPAESDSPAPPKISAAPVPSEAPAPPPAPAPIPEETIVSPDAEPKAPALASHEPKKSAKQSLSSNRESPATRYILEGQKQHREGNYIKAKQAFLRALASDPRNRRAAEGLKKVQTAMEAEEKLFKK